MRFTVKDVSKQSGLCPDTIRKHANQGRLPCTRDINGWRIFTEKSIQIARELAGINNQKPATVQPARVGMNAK